MAIAPTGAIYKSLIFDGEDSRDYGIYITGKAVYNAPQRAVEMISIPNRNGAFALDKGYFENIEVTYPAGIFADNETNFAEAISDFRNFLCSRKGYVRLSDEYNPGEYRMAVYKSGLEVSPTQLRAGEFEITFDCKPQRFLTSGEDEITIGQWGETQTVSGSIATFEGNGATGIKSLVAEINPIQAGSGTPSPSNPRTISGWTIVHAYRTGKNLLQNTATTTTKQGLTYTVNADGTVKVSGTATANSYLNISTSLTFSEAVVVNGVPTPVTSGVYMQTVAGGTNYNDNNGGGVTIPANTTITEVRMRINNGVKVNNVVFKPMIRLASETDTTYEQYNGETKTLSLGQTVYGGTLDVVSGVLTLTHKFFNVTNTMLTNASYVSGASSSSSYYYNLANVIADSDKAPQTFTLDMGAWSNKMLARQGMYTDKTVEGFTVSGRYVSIRVNSSRVADTSGASLASYLTSLDIVYPLATPTTVQLTAQQLSAISGINNVWADSGDVTVQYGNAPNMIYNPTLFDAKPLLEVEGYGNINIGDDTITLNDVAMGEIAVHDSVNKSVSYSTNPASYTFTFDDTDINTGDTITIPWAQCVFRTTPKSGYTPTSCTITSTTSATGYCNSSGTTKRVRIEDASFTYGTASTVSGSALFSQSYKVSGNSHTVNETITLAIFYVLPNQLTYRIDIGSLPTCFNPLSKEVSSWKVIADSTKSALGHPTYIDLDIGEAYLVRNGVPVSLNNVASLPNELPVLKPDGTEITYDNTVTDLKVVAHWWKV